MTGRRLFHAVARAWPRPIDVPAAYSDACRLLDLRVPPERLLRGTYTITAVGSFLGVVLAVGGDVRTRLAGVAVLAVSAGLWVAGRYGVPFAAQAKRIRALGAAPALVTTLVLGATLWPSAERAVAFATTAADGVLVERLRRHHRRAAGTPRSGLDAFADEWGEQFAALGRAVTQVEAATTAPSGERATLLARARRQILDGTRNEMARFAADLRGPATALYAFGVLLPLALVSLVPAAGAAGVPTSTAALAVVYGVFLPGVLVGASAWLLGRRPVAFPPVPVPRTHPDVPDRRWPAVGVGALAAAAGWLVADAAVPQLPPHVAAVGVGLGTTLVLTHHPAVAVRERVDEIESGLPDLMSAAGYRIERGQSVESALAEAVEEAPAATASVAEAAVERQRRLGVGVEASFLGDHGALTEIPSPRTRRVASLFGSVASIGPPGGETVEKMGSHLDELRELERETRRDLRQVTSTFSNTAGLFGPLVGGATVALAGALDAGGTLAAEQTGSLGLVVGWYVLVLAAVLTALSVGLARGLDRTLIGYRTGLALLSATATYYAAVLVAGALV